MKYLGFPLLSVVAVLAAAPLHPVRAGEFAGAVVSYQPGLGAASRYLHPEAALGAPSTVNPFGEAVDPFNPPYGTNQIVSLGAGGSLVLRFDRPVLNHPLNPVGMDFTIFGNAGFIITNEFSFETFDWVGVPATDGSMFGLNDGETRVSVSLNGRDFYTLNPALAPVVDGALPPDSAGNPRLYPSAGLSSDDFAGATLEDIRALYGGAAGGAAYDISWALDAAGRPVHLPAIRFVRIDVLSGRSEVEAVAGLQPLTGAGAGRGR